jgi:hypothetical protein
MEKQPAPNQVAAHGKGAKPISAGTKAHSAVPAKAAQAKEEEVQEEVAAVESGEKTSILKPGILLKAGVLAVINLLAVAGVVFLLDRLELKAQEVKKLRSIQLSASGGEPFSALKTDLEAAEAKTDELVEYFPDSQGLISFVGEIDKLKAEGVVTGFSFANEEPIKDKTGALGLPVLIELRGSWSAVDSALGRIMSLPYFIRAIRIEISPSLDEPTLIDFSFGGFLYVDKNFSQD